MWSFFSRDPTKAFPYDVGDKVAGLEPDQSIWSLHHGKQKVLFLSSLLKNFGSHFLFANFSSFPF